MVFDQEVGFGIVKIFENVSGKVYLRDRRLLVEGHRLLMENHRFPHVLPRSDPPEETCGRALGSSSPRFKIHI